MGWEIDAYVRDAIRGGARFSEIVEYVFERMDRVNVNGAQVSDSIVKQMKRGLIIREIIGDCEVDPVYFPANFEKPEEGK